MRVMMLGIITVASMRANSASRPRQRKRAKP